MAKYFTLSFDDGVEQDKVIISLLRKYDIPATFNLNSGLFGDRRYLEYRGCESIRVHGTFPADTGKNCDILPIIRIGRAEIAQVYRGFEIAVHSVSHADLTVLSDDELRYELLQDRAALREISGSPVVGCALPYGRNSDSVDRFLSENGFLYSRGVSVNTAQGEDKFTPPACPFNFTPTCHMTDENIEELFDEFIACDGSGRDLMFYMWGHGYEIDFQDMRKRHFLDSFERMLSKAKSTPDIILCTNARMFRALGSY